MENVKFIDDKLKVNYINQKSLLSGGTVCLHYNDITSLSVVRNESKVWFIFLGLVSAGFGFYFGLTNFNILLITFSLVVVVVGILLPSKYLGIETRSGSLYWVNVKGGDLEKLIDLIESKRTNK